MIFTINKNLLTATVKKHSYNMVTNVKHHSSQAMLVQKYGPLEKYIWDSNSFISQLENQNNNSASITI